MADLEPDKIPFSIAAERLRYLVGVYLDRLDEKKSLFQGAEKCEALIVLLLPLLRSLRASVAEVRSGRGPVAPGILEIQELRKLLEGATLRVSDRNGEGSPRDLELIKTAAPLVAVIQRAMEAADKDSVGN